MRSAGGVKTVLASSVATAHAAIADRIKLNDHFAALPQWICLMHSHLIVIERCSETGMYVGHVPGFSGAHSQGETLEELEQNMRDVIAMLLAPEVGIPPDDFARS